MKVKEEEYRKALEIWKKENPDKEYRDIPYRAKVMVNGKVIRIGVRISMMKLRLDKLDKDVRKYWESKGVLEQKRSRATEQEYREALEIWKKENPDKEYRDIPQKTVVEVNGKQVKIGARISMMKFYLDKLDNDIRKYWESKGVLDAKRPTEEEYREALEKWKENNPDKEYRDIPQKAVVEVNGKQINIGLRISYMKRNPDKLSENVRRYWESKGVLENKRLMVTEEEYREALEIWKKENPDKEYRDIPQKAVVEVNGKQVKIGARISMMKFYLDKLDNDIRKYWESKGVLDAKRPTEEEYREALEKWKENNPDKEYNEIPYKAVIEVNGKQVNIGRRINTMRAYPERLSEDVRKYWEEKGVLDGKRFTEEEYREALEIWKENNPDKEYSEIPQKAVVEVNGKQIHIGGKIANMKTRLDKLDESIRRYWEEKGVLDSKRVTEEEYREALEIWKENNPDKEYKNISRDETVKVKGKQVNIGRRINIMKAYPNKLSEDIYSYWESKGILDSKRVTEIEYRKALEIWKEKNPDKEYNEIPYKTVVEINGKQVKIGVRINTMRAYPERLSEDVRKYWEEKGVLVAKRPTEEEYREALEIWKEENPDKEYNDIHQQAVIEVNGKQVKIGRRVSTMRAYPERLSEDVRKYWELKGVLDGKRFTEEEYQKALETWKENNPDKEYRDIPFNTIVKVDRKRVNIGKRVYKIKNGKIKLTEQQQKYWEEKGLYESVGQVEETNFSEIDERYESPTDAFVQQLDIASKEIFKEMQKDIFLLSNAITSRRVSQTTENEQVEWIKELYIDLINKINMGYGEEQFILEIANMCVCLKNEFLLNESEIQFIKDKAINYYKMMRQFQSSNVELEIDVNKQLIRKKDYGLENDKKF